MAVEQIGYNGPDGMTMGATTSDTISFYGVTPVAQQTNVAANSTFLVTSNAISSSGFGAFQTAAALSTFVSEVNEMKTAMRNLGIIS